jgi:hypothetical protein
MTKSSVHHPMAFCRKHGLFLATAFAIQDGTTNLTIKHCTTGCPQRDASAEIIPGLYDVKDGKLTVKIDPSISLEAQAAIDNLADRAKAGTLTMAEAVLYGAVITTTGAITVAVIARGGTIKAASIQAAATIEAASLKSSVTESKKPSAGGKKEDQDTS